MKLIEVIRAVNDIASSQRGLFTSAQAQALGVERYALSRLERFLVMAGKGDSTTLSQRTKIKSNDR